MKEYELIKSEDQRQTFTFARSIRDGGREGDGNVARHFQFHLHENVAWLCGCSWMNKLFYQSYPLFSQEKQTWTPAGFGDLHNNQKLKSSTNRLLFKYFNNLKISDRITKLNTF
jgi:hypothetical protein